MIQAQRRLFRRTPPHLRGRVPVDCGEGKAPTDGQWLAGPDALVRALPAKPRTEITSLRTGQDALLRMAVEATCGGWLATYEARDQMVVVRSQDGARLAVMTRQEVLAAMVRGNQGMAVQNPRHVVPVVNLRSRAGPFDGDEW